MRIASIAVLVLFSWTATLHADDEVDLAAQGALLAAVRTCPLSLAAALESAYGADRRPLDAEFLLDTGGALLLRATVRTVEGETTSYETWLGRVHGAGWVPRRRPLTADTGLAEAEGRWALMGEVPTLLRKALEVAVRTEDHPGPADVALSITPVRSEGETHALLRVGVEGRVRGLRVDVGDASHREAEPGPPPAPVPFEAQALPAFDVVAGTGTWFNAESAPTFAAWLGQPVLVIVTDPG